MNVHDLERLRHMQSYAREVIAFTSGKTRDSLDSELLLLRGVTMSIGVIGEAASNVSKETQSAISQIPWREVISMRNVVIHAYHRIDKNIVWATATVAVPELLAELDKILPPDSD